MKAEYEALLKSGMFWVWYPGLSGDWGKDKIEWTKIYYQLLKLRK